MKYFDSNIIALIDMLEYDMWAIMQDSHIQCPCVNFDTGQAEPLCKSCLGTGHKLKIKKIKGVRQPTYENERQIKIEFEVGVYFFKNIYDLKEGDYIIWHNEVDEIIKIEKHCSDAEKPVYFRIETMPKKVNPEFIVKEFCRLIGRKYEKRMRR